MHKIDRNARCISIHAPLSRCDDYQEPVERPPFHFNPRTSFEVRLKSQPNTQILKGISIHAPLSRCDCDELNERITTLISIHAPLSRCDYQACRTNVPDNDFNPRTSFEVRLLFAGAAVALIVFQSTHLFRGATGIPIRALRA